MLKAAHLRIARATDHLTKIISFYRDGLGFEVIGSFADHEGFDGVMLGHPQLPYHLEFTSQQGHRVGAHLTRNACWFFTCLEKTNGKRRSTG